MGDSEIAKEAADETSVKRSWHLWVVGFITFFWNGSGTITIMMAQQGILPDLITEEAAYYAAQPLWFVLLTDVLLACAMLAGFSLLIRNRFAVTFFGISLTTIIITNLYDLAMGTSRALANNPAMLVTLIIFILACLQLLYA
jgi:hypothetical protein